MRDINEAGTAAPRFGTMSQEELMTFWGRYHRATRKDAEALVGRRPGFTVLAAKLANYACNRAVALSCRESGNIPGALVYEHAMGLILEGLPEDLLLTFGLQRARSSG